MSEQLSRMRAKVETAERSAAVMRVRAEKAETEVTEVRGCACDRM